MKRLISILFICSMLVFSGCEKFLKELLTTEIDVTDIEYETEEIEVLPPSEGSQNESFFPFEEIITFYLDDLGDGGKELNKYNKDHIKEVRCESASFTVFSTKGSSGDAINFVAGVQDKPSLSYTMDTYKLGTENATPEVKDFIEKLLLEILKSHNNELTMIISGETNLPDGEKMKLILSIKHITVKVQPT